jgi:hypothetical protein
LPANVQHTNPAAVVVVVAAAAEVVVASEMVAVEAEDAHTYCLASMVVVVVVVRTWVAKAAEAYHTCSEVVPYRPEEAQHMFADKLVAIARHRTTSMHSDFHLDMPWCC